MNKKFCQRATIVGVIGVGLLVASLSFKSSPDQRAESEKRAQQLRNSQAVQIKAGQRSATSPLLGLRDAGEVSSQGVRSEPRGLAGEELASNEADMAGEALASSEAVMAREIQAPAQERELAAARVEPGRILWEPNAENYASVQLRVSGPGTVPVEINFEAGEKIEFGMVDGDGAAWADGLYNWELTSSPKISAEARAIMSEVRDTVLAPEHVEEVLRFNGVVIEKGLTQAGSFRIDDGKPLQPFTEQDLPVSDPAAEGSRLANASSLANVDQAEGIQLRDQLYQDDLIVTGSGCFGFDCVNGESFGFDTLRLKENNLRMTFIDTSNSASFPTRDWQIAINDSANGGANYFAVRDMDSNTTPFRIVESAPNNALYVTSNGNIGLGTSTPIVDLEMKGGNTPAVRLSQDGSSGFTPQEWDIGGNESNFFIRDVTNGSALPFRITAGAPNASIYVASDGDVGLGTTTPDGILDIASRTDANDHAFIVEENGNVGIGIGNGYNPQARLDIATTPHDGGSVFVVQADGDVGIGTNTPAGKLDIAKTTGASGAFIVNANGDVGIGTAAPAGKLDIAKTTGASGAFIVNADGDVGIGTATPAGKLDVRRDGRANRVGLIMSGAGDVGIGTATPAADLHVVGNDVLIDSRGSINPSHLRFLNDSGSHSAGMTGAEFVSSGEVGGSWRWDTNAVTQMELDSGNLTVQGIVNGLSDRNAKDDIELVEAQSILEKVVDLPISEWSYKSDDSKLRHIGPMAQDFREKFGLGKDDKTIALSDTSGVALAAIKGLHSVLQEKDAEIQSLREKTEAMEVQLNLLMETIGALVPAE